MINFKNKKVLVMGLGFHDGGVGAVKFLAGQRAKLTVTDLRNKKDLTVSLKKLSKIAGVRYVLGRHEIKDFAKADYILKGPGVKPDSEFLVEARKNRVPILNDMAIFMAECPAKIIAVTGTRGKSTVAFLIWKFLRTKFKRVWLAGNIRKSVLGLLPKLRKEDRVVLELSSFQLQDWVDSGITVSGKPDMAILTNIYQDHLNWHKSFKDYIKSKSYIFKFQRRNNYLIVDPADRVLKRITKKAKAKVISPRLSKRLRAVVDQNLGRHHRAATALATKTAQLLGVNLGLIHGVLKNFYGLPGRQETIAEIKGIKFINDTTSTMPEATEVALERFWKLKNKNSKIILIAGGQDKNLDYQGLAKVIENKVKVLVLLPGTATDKIKSKVKSQKSKKFKIFEIKSIQDAVKKAYTEAKSGDCVLLSPGAASFNLFQNEFDRGDKFIKEVNKLRLLENS